MKLKLTMQQEVAILDVLEDIEPTSASVLQAGIRKLLQSGKNKVILNLIATTKLTKEFVAELVKFDAIAKEFSGHIVIASRTMLSAELKSYTSIDEAIEVLTQLVRKAEPVIADEPDVAVDPKDPFGETRARLKKAEGRNSKLKARLQSLKLDEYEKFRFENSIISKQIEALDQQIAVLTKDRRKILGAEAFAVKLQVIDKAFVDFLSADGLIPKKGGGAKANG